MSQVRTEIIRRLSPLHPTHLDVKDDSASHAGHQGLGEHVDRTGVADGTHFELTVISPLFADKPLIARHRMIYALLDDLMKNQIHALKIDARAV